MRRSGLALDPEAGTSIAPRDDAPTVRDRPRARARAIPASTPSTPPSRRFQLGSLLGHGGMGEVRLARDPRIGRDVAVKVMRDHGDPSAVARFVREACVQGRLDHPAIVPVYDLDLDASGAPYFAMKRLTGMTLGEVLQGHAHGDAETIAKFPRRVLLARLVEVCQAIEFAHSRGVIHRDLKPGNIMLGDFGEVYVLDWGIARVLDEELSSTPTELDTPADCHTAAGSRCGTAGYMPPEQVEGLPVDRRADVYALGCILFEILTGHTALPRGPRVFEATLTTLAHRPRLRYPELDVPPELDELVARSTANAPDARLASAGELAAGIQRYLDGDRDVLRRRALASQYADQASRLLATGGDRAEAMRDAGRALALDPDNQVAQDLVGHLLLTPDSTPPPEVEQALAAEQVRSGRVQLRSARLVYSMFLLAMPVLGWIGVRRMDWFLVLLGGIALNLVASAYAVARERPPGSWVYIGLALHCTTLALAGIVFGPLLILPTLVIGSVSAFLSQPMATWRAPVIAGHLVAIVAPIALELSGVVPRTFSFDAAGLRFHPWVVDVAPHVLVITFVTSVALQVFATSVLIGDLRRAKETAERMTQHQLWHLRQLVPRG